jgi:uncharacterized delta-60 repeat protein
MLWPVRCVAIAVLLFLVGAATAVAAPGDLDSSFDGDGIRLLDFSGSNDDASDLLVQPDGKLVVAGTGAVAPDFLVARLNLDGSYDTSFGGDGKSAIELGGQDHGVGAALQADGKIVVAGYTNNNMGLIRLTPDGSTDSTFDKDGQETLDFGGVDDAFDVIVQPDEKPIAAGDVFGQLAIVRTNADGSQDTGAHLANFPGTADRALAVALQPDGKIVAAGDTGSPMLGSDVAVARFNADESPDTSFYGIGRRTIDLGGPEDAARDVLVQPDGKILLIGDGGSDDRLTVTRLNADGSLDPTFGAEGTARIDVVGAPTGTHAALQANGKIVVVGFAGPAPNAVLVRLQPGGTLDTTFSDDGKQTLPVSAFLEGVALLRDGRIAVAGASGGDALVALLEGDSAATGGGPGGGGGQGGGSKTKVPRCAGKRATIVGTNKANKLKGTRRNDVIVALGGNDKVDGGAGNDLICAGNGNDTVKGGKGKDRLYGQSGKDTENGGDGNDRLDGGPGNDRLTGDSGKDSIAGGSGKDRLSGGGGRDSCNGGGGKDRAACERRRSV